MANLQNWVISKILIDGSKQIEKINWMTKALEVCYKKKEIKKVWQKFLDATEGILNDAKDEISQARKWV